MTRRKGVKKMTDYADGVAMTDKLLSVLVIILAGVAGWQLNSLSAEQGATSLLWR